MKLQNNFSLCSPVSEMAPGELSPNLAKFKCFVRCYRNFLDGKKPWTKEKGLDWNTQLCDYQTACQWIQAGQNIGFAAGQSTIIIDLDKFEAVTIAKICLPPTYEESTPSGGRHLIFSFFGKAANANLKLNGIHIGEIRADRQYCIIAPSVAQSKIDNRFYTYKILRDVEPVVLQQDVLQKFLSFFDKEDDAIKFIATKEKASSALTTLGGCDRSRYDFAKCCELIEQGLGTYESVRDAMILHGSQKWQNRDERYRQITFAAALRTVNNHAKV